MIQCRHASTGCTQGAAADAACFCGAASAAASPVAFAPVPHADNPSVSRATASQPLAERRAVAGHQCECRLIVVLHGCRVRGAVCMCCAEKKDLAAQWLQ